MATSLAAQLKKLRTPQTNLLLQDKKRASLLFDPKEAANLDRDTVLNIGQSGLQELVKLSFLFENFNTTLYAQSSLSFERAVQDVTVNKKLDTDIAKFLMLLSPYFLLNTSHKALEWLIYRYHIHQYNRDQYILLILPYHETRIFIRALQLMDLSDEHDKWHWLAPLQKRGVPLASGTLVNRLSTDNGLLKMLCTHVIAATKTYSDQASCLATLYAFYTTIILGVIEQASTITEVQVNHLLPTLLFGLASSITDLAASSYMIIAKLMMKTKFKADTMEKLLLKTFKTTHMKQQATVFLIHLYQSPIDRLTVVPESLVSQLSGLSWFVETVAKVHSSDTNVSQFVVSLLQAACQVVVESNQEITSNIRTMISDLMARVKLDEDAVDTILTKVLTCEFLQKETSKDAKDFLAQFYQSLERGYPERFDAYLKHLMKRGENDTDAKKMLHFLTSWSFGTKDTQDSIEILDKLMHINAAQRITALQILTRDNVSVPESFWSMMTSTLQARFYDSDVNVVKTLLSFPTKRLTNLLSTDILIEELLVLLSTCHTSSKKELAKPALKILLELCEESNDTSVFITALPYLFPITEDDVDVAKEVLYSNFAKKNLYMQHVLMDIKKCKLNAETVSTAAFHNILSYELLPATESILNSMRQQMPHGDAASLFFNMILLGSVCRVPVGSMPAKVAREVIEITTEMIKKYPRVKLLLNCNNITGDNIREALKLTSEGILPLQVGTYVLEMVHRRLNLKSESKLDFDDNAEHSHLILRLLEIFFEGMGNRHCRKHYSRCLQIFFQRHFATMQDLVRFLSQLYTRPVKVQTSYHCLQITSLLLNQSSSVSWVFQDQHLVVNLLLSFARRSNACRAVALNILSKLTQTFNLTADPFFALLQELAARSAEIGQDPDQLSLILYVLLSPDPDVSRQVKQRKKLQEVRKLLFDVATQPDMPIDRRSQLLDVLTHVNSTDILKQLTPLGLELLRKPMEERSYRSAGSILRNILERFDNTTVDALNNERVWSLFEACILEYEPRAVTESGERVSPSIVLLKQINEMFFARAGDISRDLQTKILSKILDVMTDSEISGVISSAGRAIRRIRVDATIIMSELLMMKSSEPEQECSETTPNTKKKRKRQSQMYLHHPAVVHGRAWKRGVVLLEFVQRADNIQHEELLYGVLFELLNVCLSLDEQSPVEYTNQLILLTIHRLLSQGLPMRDTSLQIALITKCIRTSRNPQTHYHALLVLIELLKKVDVRRALFNIMPIFTFMGSTVVRQDDAYSIQIISKVLETVVPIVNATDDETHACELLRIFIVSLPDIPEHRRMPLFVKLLQLLQNHLHLYYLLTFESHVLTLNEKITNQQTTAQRLEFALQVSREFPPRQLLQVCVKIAEFIKALPIDIVEERDKQIAIKFPYKHVYDVSKSTPKILRHYKITVIQFFSNLLSSQDFINRVAELSEDEANELNEYYDRLTIELILLIQTTSKIVDQHQSKLSNVKYWKVLLHHLYDVLDLVNNLLPNRMFLQSVKHLLGHELLSVKKKALELLNTRLLQKKFSEEDYVNLLSLIESLVSLLDIEIKIESQEQEVVQQTVLISLKLLAKLLAADHPAVFKPILEMTTELLRTRDGPMLASAALCVAELSCSMRTHALYSLNKFVPAILKLLGTHCHQDVPDVIIISIVSALQKIVESLSSFLSLYLDQLLSELTRLSSLYTDTENPKIGIVVSRLKTTTQKLSSCIPLRVLLPAVNRTYQKILISKSYRCIPSLMSILALSFDSVQPLDLNVAISDLSKFFLQVFQFREDIEDSENDMEIDDDGDNTKNIVAVEESASKALVELVLKLSEATFRPLYEEFYRWAEKNTKHKQRNITFYRLSANIAECLKSLFILFAGLFLKHAALLLNGNNTFVNDIPNELTLPDEPSRIELVEAILLTLHRVFNYDAHNFVSQDRFEILHQPIVDQIENTMGTKEEYESRASRLIVPCIASFASAIPDDSLHKQLVYQTLLKTRHTKPYVRSTALNALVEIARKLGEDFMPLLPETVPFLAELLEDEDEVTEKCAQNAVRTLEEILGEPLQKYF